MNLGRTDTSVLGRWWWTVDRWTILAVFLLAGIGMLLTMAASPAIADRIGVDSFHFIRRQFIFLVPALGIMIAVSLLPPLQIRRLGSLGYLFALMLLVLVLLIAPEVNGARRWLSLAGTSFQPSELAKPCFAVTLAWVLSEGHRRPGFPGKRLACVLYLVTVLLLLRQPDVGQSLIISAIWAIEFFLAGLPLYLVGGVIGLGAAGAVGAYFTLPHIQQRVDQFMGPNSEAAYQVLTALKAFRSGGFFGRGPGEGRVKLVLPDAHTDFILAVGGEEFGAILCLLVVALFAFVVLRGLSRLTKEENLFTMLACTGLLTQFGLQSIINMASSLRLMPAKGMTLPFISYGGSSMLALALGMGMILALTRTRYGSEGWGR